MVKFVLHFGFLVAGVALIARRGVRFYWYALAAFCGGIALNAGYGVVQLALAEVAGTNLDEILIEPITSRQTGINVFGAVGGTQEVFRPNALTGDPNHLGIELLVPLSILTPLYLRLETGHRLRTPLAACSASSSSSSSRPCPGAACSAWPAARSCWRSPTDAICGGPRSCSRSARSRWSWRQWSLLGSTSFSRSCGRGRNEPAAASPHFEVYSFVPDVLSSNPLLGLGLNNFADLLKFVTGKPDFGPHSFYVATLVETGLVGARRSSLPSSLWLFRRLDAAPEGSGVRLPLPQVTRSPLKFRSRSPGNDGCAPRDPCRQPLLPDDHPSTTSTSSRRSAVALPVVFRGRRPG